MTDAENMTAGPQRGPVATARRALEFIDALSRWVIVLMMAGMAISVSLQVFHRYVLSSSVDSADELSRLFFVWAIFLAIPHGIRRGVHVGIDLFVKMLPDRVSNTLARISSLSGMVLMAIVFVTTIQATSDKWGELMPTLPVTAALYYVPVLISAIHSALHLALMAVAGPGVWGEEAWKEGI